MPMTEIEWSNDAAVRLIEEYRQRPELWDATNDLYRVQTAKYEAWSDMARLFECDIADLRKKLNSIFASHRREKAKVRCGGRSTWFLYPHMKFLPTHLENDNNAEIIVNPPPPARQRHEDSEESSVDEEDLADHEITIKDEPITETYIPKTETMKYKYKTQKTHKARLTRVVKRKIVKTPSPASQLDSRLLETLELLRRTEKSRKKDECDSFGEYIADSLRKHDERTQSMIKQAINNILFEQEMKKYSAGHYTVLISGMEENPLILGENDASEK